VTRNPAQSPTVGPPGHRGRRVAALLAVLVLLSTGLASAAFGAGVAQADQSPIGVHSMLQLNDPYSFMQDMFVEAAELHASSIRLDVAPAIIFGSPSQPPNFSGLDEVMALSQQYQLPVEADLLSVPYWLADCASPSDSSLYCPTTDLPAYQSIISQIVTHADPVIHDWEVWNEPDNSQFFTGTPQQYAWMLRTAHDAIKQVDPSDQVLLGGISSTAGMPWLTQVFATPGADAAQAFDIANVHERGGLDSLAAAIKSWKGYFSAAGFNGPLWVTEHGYPSDPAYQYDAHFAAGPSSQAAYLDASIPTLVDAGAAMVFVTERDNLGGYFGSEGLLGGNVSDPAVANPTIIQKPSFAAVQALSECYIDFGRDCPGAAPVASPGVLQLPAAAPGASGSSTVTVSDPGPSPLNLGAVVLSQGLGGPIAIQHDACSGLELEPDQTCTVTLRFAPAAGGNVSATLSLPSDNGTMTVPVAASAPSVSSLRAPGLGTPAFVRAGAGDGVHYTQRLTLQLTNPLGAPIRIARAQVSGPEARRFKVGSDRCARSDLNPGAECVLAVMFKPLRAGSDRAILTLSGDGAPLKIALHATAVNPPAIRLLSPSLPVACLDRAAQNSVVVLSNQPSLLRWSLVRRRHPLAAGGCSSFSASESHSGPAGHKVGSGGVFTGSRRKRARGSRGYLAHFALRLHGRPRALVAGTYRLTVEAVNQHGTSQPQAVWVTVPGG
jgi:hypothetical protein